ncbi:MAG: type III PLP-dependent enzyme [Rhizobiales bacterium]|nr:type III PLP-dependent enzyme [Hyphomicrobiales bacterium]
MTARIREFLKNRKDEGPCLVVDIDVVRENYVAFANALPDTKVFYAVKANPAPEILKLLAGLGSSFDVASVSETETVLAAGATPDRISYGNTIKKESEIASAFKLGVTLFAVDCEAEVEKVARAAPGSRVICRIHCDGTGSEWPLSRKFGCEPEFAADILELAHKRGLIAHGISFHVGSQQHNVEAWDRALASTAAIFRACAERGISLAMVNLGGGFPAKYLRKTPKLESYGKAIFRALRRHFGNRIPETIIEPGRGLVGNAGVIEAEVVLIAKRSPEDETRWVYLDIGKFHGLAETIDESIRYPIKTRKDRDEMAPCIVAGPTCDSVDVLYEKNPYPLPVSLAIGDKVLIEATGAYTTTYSSIGFNGYPPLRQYVI